MKARIFYLTIALFMALVAVIVPATTARAATINVPGDYSTIQAAVDAASPGDTIVVAAGTYSECVTIGKSLTLRGAQAGVDARGRSGAETEVVSKTTNTPAFWVTSSAGDTSIDGFTFKGWRATVKIECAKSRFINNIVIPIAIVAGTPPALVYIDGSSNDVTVQYNDVSPMPQSYWPSGANAIRITVVGVASVLVKNNWLHNASAYPSALGAGLGLFASNSGTTITVSNNKMYDNGSDGMFTYNSTFGTLTVSGNDIYNNAQRGVKVAPNAIGDVQIHNNNIYNNGMEGVANQRGLPIVDATNNWWGDASGPNDPAGSEEVPPWPAYSEPTATQAALNADGSGDGVSDNVKYSSWTDAPIAPSGPVGGCFIATAAYGSYLDSHVQTLRDFRDKYLVTNVMGSKLVSAYYRLSPPIAEFIDEHPSVKPTVRVGLLPAVAMSTVAVNTTLAEKMAIVCSLAFVSVALAMWARRQGNKSSEPH